MVSFDWSALELDAAALSRATKKLYGTSSFGEPMLGEPEALSMDSPFQRGTQTRFVREIMLDFDPHLFGSLIIGKRGSHRGIIDGQHRELAVLGLKENGDARLREALAKVPQIVYPTKTEAEEARLYVELNGNRRHLLPQQIFAAKLSYNDQLAKAVERAVKRNKFQLQSPDKWNTGSSDNRIGAVTLLEAIARRGGENRLNDVLFVVRRAYDGERYSLTQYMLRGVERVLEKEAIPKMTLARALKRAYDENEIDAFEIVQRAARMAHRGGGGRVAAMASVLKGTCEKYA